MKKTLFILLLVLFPILAFAEEPEITTFDKIKIENMHVQIFYNRENPKIIKRFDTKILYGNSSDTYFLDFFIPYEYGLYNLNGKTSKYKAKDSNFYISTDEKHTENPDTEGLAISVGDYTGIYKENDYIQMGYNLIFDEKLPKNTSFPILTSDYDVSGIFIEIFMDKEELNKTMKFSLDNKTFTSTLDGLEVEKNVENKSINIEYSKPILKNKTLYFLIEESTNQKTSLRILLYSVLGIFALSLVFITFKYFKNKNLTKVKKQL